MYINKATIYGNLTRDPETKQLPSGVGVTNLGVATNRTYTNKEGQKTEDVEFHNVVFFGRLSELVQQYLTKGSPIYVEGRLRTSTWEKDGTKHYKTEIVGENMQFGPKRAGSGSGSDSSTNKRQVETPQQPQKESTINPDDIPF